jgi:hypothetical protein
VAKKWYSSVGVIAATILAVGGIIVAGMYIWNDRSQMAKDNKIYKAELDRNRTKINELQQQLSNKNGEVQRLETLLTPFRTIALEKYTGSEQEALRKLANELEKLKSYVNPFKKPIASASANVQVNIKSEEQVNETYMSVGGFLTFVKNRQSLLLTSDTKSSASQTGKGEVIYKGNFQIEPNQSAIGKPVEILQESDLIHIEFNIIPENSRVLKGNASVVINGDLRLDFEILPQQMQGKTIIIRDIKNKFLISHSNDYNL